MKDAHLIVKGFVQGIGYRKWVRKEAQKLGITGWVRNLPDGSVEVLLQGEKPDIEKMILLCRKGPFMAEIKSVNLVWEDPSASFGSAQNKCSGQDQREAFIDFSIRHDF